MMIIIIIMYINLGRTEPGPRVRVPATDLESHDEDVPHHHAVRDEEPDALAPGRDECARGGLDGAEPPEDPDEVHRRGANDDDEEE